MDDAASSLTGPKIAVYFWNGADREYLLENRFLEILVFSAATWTIFVCVMYATVRPMFVGHSLTAHILTLVAFIAFLLGARNAVDDDHIVVWNMFIPHIGLWAIAVSTLVSMVMILASERSHANPPYGHRFR